MAEEGKFMLRLSKSLWNKAESTSSVPAPSSMFAQPTAAATAAAAAAAKKAAAAAEPEKVMMKKNCSDECSECGAIALAGNRYCINCFIKKQAEVGEGEELVTTAPASRSRNTSVLRLGKGGVIRGTFNEVPGKGDKVPTMRPEECSKIVEKEMGYIRALMKLIPQSVRPQIVDSSAGQTHTSAVCVMKYSEVAEHLIKLRLDPVHRLLRPIITKFMQHPRNVGGVFNRPVNLNNPALSNYLSKIEHPSDLGSIRAKLQRGDFESIAGTAKELYLVFNNAMTYNPPEHHLHQLAKIMKTELDSELKSLDDKLVRETERKHAHGSACKLCLGEVCNLCGEKCLKFEAAVLVCHGACTQRIKRNTTYFVSDDGANIWCHRCYSSLPQVIAESPNKPPLLKRNLLKARSDEEVSEPWVECDTCHKWVHQICGLYNDRYLAAGEEKDDNVMLGDDEEGEAGAKGASKGIPPVYQCPRCKLEKKAVSSAKSATSARATAAGDGDSAAGGATVKKEEASSSSSSSSGSGKRKRGGDDIDGGGNDGVGMDVDNNSSSTGGVRIKEEHGDGSAWKPTGEDRGAHEWCASTLPRSRLSDFVESMVAEQLTQTGYADVVPSISVRMVSNSDNHVEVPEPIVQNMCTSEGKKVPQYLEYRQKCLLLFQTIDGVDTVLFCLYVQEFGDDCPEPNRGSVYISYLDSVDYFRPVECRTMVYHEIMVAYLKWAQMRGFRQGHIWSCPPQRGDNFIFWCHPAHQRTPSRDRLNGWYSSMLQRCAKLGFVDNIQNLYTTNFGMYEKKAREGIEPRKAARNSFVGAGKILKPGTTSTSTLMEQERERVENGGEGSIPFESLAPVAPPIFEGDYWVNEFLRLHRATVARTVGNDGMDRDANRRKSRELLKVVMSQSGSQPFCRAVDPVALKIPDYYKVITQPMDLGTVREKSRRAEYRTMVEFANDVRLTFRNAIKFNPAGNAVHANAIKLTDLFESELRKCCALYACKDMDDATVKEVDALLATYPLGATKYKAGSSAATAAVAAAASSSVSFSDDLGGGRRTRGNSATSMMSDPHDGDSTIASGGGDDDDTMSRNSATFSEASSAAPELRRQTSLDSMVSAVSGVSSANTNGGRDSPSGDDTSWGGDDQVQSLRPFHSSAMRGALSQESNATPYAAEPFPGTDIGLKSSMSLMADLSRGVERLKQDLFVIKFTSPLETAGVAAASKSGGGKRRKVDQIAAAAAEEEEAGGTADEGDDSNGEEEEEEEQGGGGMKAEPGESGGEAAAHVPIAALPICPVAPAEVAVAAAEVGGGGAAAAATSASRPPAIPIPAGGRGGNRGLKKKKESSTRKGVKQTYTRRAINVAGSVIEQVDTCIADGPLALLENISTDTADPDPTSQSPMNDSRHTFLEMCQFRHYQFDTLRRAKHSSMMIIYHLQHPYAKCIRPLCSECKQPISDVRWHCGDGCADHDTCQKCYADPNIEHAAGHKLIPFRVTFE